jgi:hypothetical protein
MTAFLTQLGAAAQHPYALIAYLTVAILSAINLWRVRRNKNLLKHLEKIPAAQRGTVLIAEMGTAYLSRGLSPEQWLRSKIHTYVALIIALFCICAVVITSIAILNTFEPPTATIQVAPGD